MVKQKLSHLFLDLDGTLINSLPKLKSIYQNFLSDFKIQGTKQEFESLKTSSIERLIDYFKEKYSIEHPTHQLKQQYELYLQKHYFSAPLFPGVKSYLKEMSSQGYQLILTTANQRQCALKVLHNHGLSTLFDGVFTPFCFELNKKNQDFYQKVLETLKLNESEALVVDDSVEVVSAATEAGLQALLFSKITYHPLPSFGSWKTLQKQWSDYAHA